MTDRFLIIDDDTRLGEMLRDYLNATGAVVEARLTGQAGIDAAVLAQNSGRGFDAIILDVMLPDIDGFEVCRRLRTQLAFPS